MSDRKIIHLEINGLHYYYGNILAMCKDFDETALGLNYTQIKYQLSKKPEFKNDKCIIREGFIRTKSMNEEK